MPFEAMVVAIVAMVLGYKLLSQFMKTLSNRKHPKNSGDRRLMSYDEQMDLKARADELKRRLHTLEEIIGSERRAS